MNEHGSSDGVDGHKSPNPLKTKALEAVVVIAGQASTDTLEGGATQ